LPVLAEPLLSPLPALFGSFAGRSCPHATTAIAKTEITKATCTRTIFNFSCTRPNNGIASTEAAFVVPDGLMKFPDLQNGLFEPRVLQAGRDNTAQARHGRVPDGSRMAKRTSQSSVE